MYDEVLKSVNQWIFNVSKKYADLINIEIVSNNSYHIIADLTTNRYIAQLSVSKPDFRPYRFVEFYVLDINKNEMQPPAFVYGDKENESIFDIIDNLNKGIDFILSEI